MNFPLLTFSISFLPWTSYNHHQYLVDSWTHSCCLVFLSSQGLFSRIPFSPQPIIKPNHIFSDPFMQQCQLIGGNKHSPLTASWDHNCCTCLWASIKHTVKTVSVPIIISYHPLLSHKAIKCQGLYFIDVLAISGCHRF